MEAVHSAEVLPRLRPRLVLRIERLIDVAFSFASVARAIFYFAARCISCEFHSASKNGRRRAATHAGE